MKIDERYESADAPLFTCAYCGDCGAVVPLALMRTHDDFHDRLVFSEVR